jgi:hypothetical protein
MKLTRANGSIIIVNAHAVVYAAPAGDYPPEYDSNTKIVTTVIEGDSDDFKPIVLYVQEDIQEVNRLFELEIGATR